MARKISFRPVKNAIYMKKITAILAAALSFTGLAAQNANPDAPGENVASKASKKALPKTPLAPAQYRRPAGYTPKLFELNLAQISEKHSARTIERGQKAFAKVAAVNAAGKWKPEAKSIDAHKCPEWFIDAKFGIFIDWGLYSVASWAPARDKGATYPDWYELRMYSDFTPDSNLWGFRSYHIKNWGEDFQRDHFIPLFKAQDFDAKKLAEVFSACGAKYVVPFFKHHSGFCLWDSSYTFRDTVDMGPKRDIAREIADACAEKSLKFGFYFSLTEWEYPILGKDGKMQNFAWGKTLPYSPDMEYKASGKIAVKDYVREYLIPQAAEFIDKYDPDILWFDGEWNVPATELGGYDLAAYFYNVNEGRKPVAVNDRYGEGAPEEIAGKAGKRLNKILRSIRGDFFTDEFGDAADCIDPAKYHPWESCRGISQSYGNNWRDDESNVLTSNEFISMFADTVARGGNLLLLVNLDGRGAIPEVQKKRLLDIGKWLGKYGEAIYSTRVIAPFATPEIAYTRAKDGRFAYAIVKNPKAENVLELAPRSGVKPAAFAAARHARSAAKKLAKITLLPRGEALEFSKAPCGKILLKLPAEALADGLPVAVKLPLK